MLLPDTLTASFPTCNSILKSITVLSRCLLNVFRLCLACKFASSCISLRSESHFCCSIFLLRGGIFGARILFMIFPFYFKGNEDKLLRQRTNLRRKSVCCCCFFLVKVPWKAKHHFFNCSGLGVFLMHKECLEGSLFLKKWNITV